MYSNHYLGQYAEDIDKLDFHQKLRLGVLILRDQRIYVAHFDDVYDEELLPLYEDILSALESISGSEIPYSSLAHLRNISRKHIPDTDVFPSEDGTFAQYAMISACYLLAFATEHNVDQFYHLTDIYMENLCAQNQCADEPLNDDMLYEHITGIWSSLIANLKQETPYP